MCFYGGNSKSRALSTEEKEKNRNAEEEDPFGSFLHVR